jgi:predicted nucleic acid-binding protein
VVAIADAIARRRIIGLDTSVFIYQFEGKPPEADVTTEVFRLIQTGMPSAVTSVITIAELMVQPLQRGLLNVADDYEQRLIQYPHLEIVDIDLQTARLASSLRATYRLRTPDALQIAACLAARATAFLTNDTALRRVRELEILMLSEYSSGS